MNYTLDKGRGGAVRLERAVLRSPFSVLRSPFSVRNPGSRISVLAVVCAVSIALIACDTGSGGDSDGGGGGTTTSRSVEGVSLDRTSVILLVNGTDTLTHVLSPVNASNKKVTWSSSDPTTVEVTGGAIKGLKLGDATVTVTTVDGSHTASCAVSVKAVKSIAIAGTAKYWYEADEEFDIKGLTLEVSYEDGTSSGGIPITSSMISAPHGWNTGTGGRAISITYGGKTTKVAVMLREPTQIVLSGQLGRTHYGIGEEFDPAGLYYSVIFSDGPNLGPLPVEASMIFPADWNAVTNAYYSTISNPLATTFNQSGPNSGNIAGLAVTYHGVSTGGALTGANTAHLRPAFSNDGYHEFRVANMILRRPNLPPKGFDNFYYNTATILNAAGTASNVVLPAGAEWVLKDAGGYTSTLTLYNDFIKEYVLSGPKKMSNAEPGGVAADGVVLSEPFTNLTIEGFKSDRKVRTSGRLTGLNSGFVLTNGTNLTLGDHLIIEGHGDGDRVPLVQVNDVTGRSTLTMKSGSKIKKADTYTGTSGHNGYRGYGLVRVTKGTVIMEKGAEIIGAQAWVDNTEPLTGGAYNAPNDANQAQRIPLVEQPYRNASAVLVEAEGTLIMNGGKITGDLGGTTANAWDVGAVGDVVINGGNLELGGDAHIGTLALAADVATTLITRGSFSKPITINAGWTPPTTEYGNIKLNLSGNITDITEAEIKDTIKYFDGKALFKPGAGVTTDTMDKFDLRDIFYNKSVIQSNANYQGRGNGTISGTFGTNQTIGPHEGQYLYSLPTNTTGYHPTHTAKSETTGSNYGFNLKTPNVGQFNHN